MTEETKDLHQLRGITFAELGALYGVREMLRAGHLDHAAVWDQEEDAGKHLFCMNIGAEEVGDCGSAMCIGGAMGQVMGRTVYDANRYVHGKSQSDPLYPLFFPPDRIDYDSITAEEAAQAIDNFLKTGDPHWEDIADAR